MGKKKSRRIAVIDFETDPFLYGRFPRPFAAGFYDGENYIDFWGDTALTDLVNHLIDYPDPLIIYAHNGGKFDFFYLLEKAAIENPMLIIHGRIVKARCLGRHEIRDSYAILPLPLAKLGNSQAHKLEIDYSKLEKKNREKNKGEILEYQKQDCITLYNVVAAFRERFGDRITVAGTAIRELQNFYPVPHRSKKHDNDFRPYYFGGRVQCFEAGELIPHAGKSFKVFDVNSMYPDVMRNYKHPNSGLYIRLGDHTKFDRKTGRIKGFIDDVYFIRFTGANAGALPVRKKEGGLDFNVEYGEFFACSHEVKAALELGLIRIDDIETILIPSDCCSFDLFVDKFMAEKIHGKATGDAQEETFSKLMLNSAYGRYAIDPGRFKTTFIYNSEAGIDHDIEFLEFTEKYPDIYCELSKQFSPHDPALLQRGAELIATMDHFQIWEAPDPDDKGYCDVAVAASITSAARSVLLRAIQASDRPLYCDTDSLICEGLNGVPLDNLQLGAWKFEGQTDRVYIAGKKMYALYPYDEDWKPITDKTGRHKAKIASKGAKLDYDDIVALCRGQVIHWKNDAPNFKLNGAHKFVERNIVKNA